MVLLFGKDGTAVGTDSSSSTTADVTIVSATPGEPFAMEMTGGKQKQYDSQFESAGSGKDE